MTDKELRKLNRAELLELLVEQSRENDRLREQVQQMEQKLSSRQIMLDEAGSIAEASLRVNQVFEAAQMAANQYIESIQELSGRQESICAKMEEESRLKSEQMLAETQEKCSRMTREAEEKADRTWTELRRRLDQFIDQQAGLREMLSMVSGEPKHT